MARQRTIRQAIKGSGIGVHSGKLCELTMEPAPIDTGIVFRRLDMEGKPEYPVKAENVHDTQMSTTMVVDGVRIATIEHLMSALAGLGIDNLYLDVNSDEVPIMDGSAAAFIYMLQQAGIKEQDAGKNFIKILEPLEVKDGDKWARLTPFNGFRLDFTIDFNHPVFKQRNNHVSLDFSSQRYIKEVSRARTFGFLKDIEFLQSNGLALGGSLDNAVVIDDYRVLNEHGLRFDDEFARHKMLDAIGDLYMLGAPIIGWYQGFKSGHALNNALCLLLEKTKANWEWVSSDEIEMQGLDYGIADHSIKPAKVN